MRRMTTAAAVVCLCALVGGTASAAPLAGTFTLAGLAPVRVGANYIDWGQTGPIFGTPTGDVLFTSADGSFAGLNLTTGTLLDLTNPPALVGTPINIEHFLTATAQPSWNFALTYITPGEGTEAGCLDGNTATNCTPAGSPFTLTESGGNVAVALSMMGTVMDQVGTVSQWEAIFTTQFVNNNVANILQTLARQGFVESSHSSDWDVNAEATPVPEPASMMLLGTGLAVIARGLRKRSA